MIAVFGSGSWGTALAAVLARNTPSDVFIWGRDQQVLANINTLHINQDFLPSIELPSNLKGEHDWQQLLSNHQDLLIAIPSKGFVEFVRTIKPYITTQHRILWATKGLEPKTGRFLHEVIEEELGTDRVYGILTGPSFALEVAKQMPTAVIIASRYPEFAQEMLEKFHCPTFRVYSSDDVIGAQLGGVAKNVLAVAAGISDGLGFGANARAALITRGMAEMRRLGSAMGVRLATLNGLAGVGDIILTCTDDQSRNRRFGLALARGESSSTAQHNIGQVVEAAHNVVEICKLAASYNIELPIAEQVLEVIQEKTSAQDAAYNLISRKPIEE